MGDPTRTLGLFLRSLSKSRKRNFVSAEVVFQRLHSSVTLEIWTRSARQIRSLLAPRGPSPGVRLCLTAAVLRILTLSRPTSRPERLRQLAVQLASLASLEDVVTHGLQCLLETLLGLIAPVSVAEHALLPIGLTALSCSVSVASLVWPSRAAPRLRLGALPPPIAAPAPRPVLHAFSNPRARASTTRAPTLSAPCRGC